MSTAEDASEPNAGRSASVEAILAAGHRLMGRGQDFTTQDVIDEAGVARRTFYRSFASKDDLLLAVIGDQIEQFRTRLDAAASEVDDPIARLRLFVDAALSTLQEPTSAAVGRFVTSEHWHLHQARTDEMMETGRPVIEFIKEALVDGAAAGVLHPTDVEQDAWIVFRLIMSAYHHYAFAGADEFETMSATLWRFCIAGLGGPRP